jgi:ankyrin repeat protein
VVKLLLIIKSLKMQDEIKAALTEVEKSYSSTIEEMRVVASYGHIPHFKLIILLSADMQLTADGDKKLRELLSKDEQAILAVCEAENDQADISSFSSDILNNPEIANLILLKSLVVSKWNLSVSILKIITNFDYQDRSGNGILNALAMTNDIDDDKIEEEIERFIRLLESKDYSQVESLINANSLMGETVLHRAVRNENVKVVKWLITRGIDVSKRNLDYDTALDIAVQNNKPQMVLEILQSYEKKGILNKTTAIYQKQHISKDYKGNERRLIEVIPIMQWAVLKGNYDLLDYLIDNARFDINDIDSEGKIAMHYAAESCNLEVVKYLVEKGADINDIDSEGKIAMHYAAESGNLEVVKYLVEKGDRVNVVDEECKGMIYYAVRSGNLKLIEYLVEEKGLNVNDVDVKYERTMHYAVSSGRLDIIEYVIKKGGYMTVAGPMILDAAKFGSVDLVRYLVDNQGADVNVVYSNNKTLMHYAVGSGSVDLVRYLVDSHGVDVNVVYSDGKTVMDYAVASGSVDLVRYLVDEKKININDLSLCEEIEIDCPIEGNNLSIIEYLADKGLNINNIFICDEKVLHYLAKEGNVDLIRYLVDKKGLNVDLDDDYDYERTALHFAAWSGNLDLVRYLVDEKGLNVDAYDIGNQTALHYAACSSNYLLLFELVQLVNHTFHSGGVDEGKKALKCKAKYGDLDVIEFLIAKGANVNGTNIFKKTPLHYAANSCRLNRIKYLIDKGADINATDRYGKTSLHYAVEFDYLKLVHFLLEHNANVNRITSNNRAIAQLLKAAKDPNQFLLLGAKEGNLTKVKIALGRGANINLVDDYNSTALHYAADKGEAHVIKYLLQNGADINAIDNYNGAALHYAAGHGNLGLIKYLIEQKAKINIVNSKNQTALHFAVESGSIDVMEYLIMNGVNVDVIDSCYNATAIYYAVDQKNIKAIEKLLEHNVKTDGITSEDPEISGLLEAAKVRNNDASFANRLTDERMSQAEEMQQHGR